MQLANRHKMKLNILVTDDCSTVRLLISKTIRLSDLPVDRIIEAENGAEGLKQMAENRVDLILMDINMPEMDGVTMLEHMRMNPEYRKIPVLVVTAESNKQRVPTTDMDNIAFLSKPFTPQLLRDAVINITGVTNS